MYRGVNEQYLPEKKSIETTHIQTIEQSLSIVSKTIDMSVPSRIILLNLTTRTY